MKRLLALCLLALCLWPGHSLAAADPISVSEYQNRLGQVAQRLQSASAGGAGAAADLTAARTLLSGMPPVATPGGARDLDLSPLADAVSGADPATSAGRQRLSEAGALAREYQSAAAGLGANSYQPPADAHLRLERALAAARATNTRASLLDRLRNWLVGLLPSPTAATVTRLGWGAVLIGAAGLALLGFFVARALAGHTAGSEYSAGAGRAAGRPLSAAELRQRAQGLAGAGQYREALSTLHLALLQHYDRLRLLRYVPAQTNREHVRQVGRTNAALGRLLQDLSERVDGALYGGRPLGADEYDAAADLTGRLWQEGEAASTSATPGASSSAPSP